MLEFFNSEIATLFEPDGSPSWNFVMDVAEDEFDISFTDEHPSYVLGAAGDVLIHPVRRIEDYLFALFKAQEDRHLLSQVRPLAPPTPHHTITQAPPPLTRTRLALH